MRVYTIGFARKPASTFFRLLRESGANRLVDVRLNNTSQLAGFTKRDDLAYFLDELCDLDYAHELRLAPTRSMLDGYRKKGMSWEAYERCFVDLMAERRVEQVVPRELIDGAVLLCSEPTPRRCHRRLVVEYLARHWGDIEICHL